MRSKKQRKSDQSDEDDSDASVEVDTNNAPKYIPVAKLGDKLKTKKIVINISDTQYPVIEEVAEELGWIIQKEEGQGDWDVWWTDREIEPHTLFRMNLQQKINHFPGIYILARKNLFGLGLMAMKEYHPQQYNFFPQTWTIPLQFSQFRHYYQSIQKGKTRTYIVKPEAMSQGRGIFLTRNIEDILNGNKYVIQRYVKSPMLIDRLKFDLRIYVLLAGTDPLRLYIYNQGLTRFATEQYQQPTNDNLNCSYIHLTNYSLNKNNPKYIYNTSEKDMDKGHKRSLSSTYEKLHKNGVDTDKLKQTIEDMIVKSVISGLPTIRHQYQYCQPEQYQGNMCFHILGFDVMLTSQCQPIIIEINHTPSFETGTPLDYLIKKNLVKDTLKVMRVTQKNKKKHFERAKEIAKIRLETGRREIFKGKERQEVIAKARQLRDQQQKELLGGYKRIFPPEDPALEAKYNKFYQTAVRVSREENDPRKKLLNEQKKKSQPQKDRKDNKMKKAYSKQQKSATQEKHKEHLQKIIARPSNSKLKGIEAHQMDVPVEQIKEMDEELRYKKEQLMQPVSATIHNKADLRSSFRMKVNKKVQGSNQQLVKYTESIRKFNDLMVKFVMGKEVIDQPKPKEDNQAFNRLKDKISGHDNKVSSLGGYKPISRQGKQPPLPTKTVVQGIQNGGGTGTKVELRNGTFIKPKNYLISDVKGQTHAMKIHKKWSGEDSMGRQKEVAMVLDPILGSLIGENRSRAYSKLLKPAIGRNLMMKK